MKLRLLPLALVAGLLLAFGAFAAACGGEDSLTLEEYFLQLEALSATAGERVAELDDATNAEMAAAVSEKERLAALEDFYTNFQTVAATFADGLNDLNPPAAVEDLHNEYVDESAELVASIEEMLNGLDLDSVTELFDEESGFNQVVRPHYETCAALQDIADENEIDVDLHCVG